MSTNSEAERALRGVLGVLLEYADELILIGGAQRGGLDPGVGGALTPEPPRSLVGMVEVALP